MINKSYKIWIIIFVMINSVLLAWSLDYLKFLEEKFLTQDDIITIEPENKFKKTLPPKDESFPNERSKIWGAFENQQNQEINDQDTTEAENTIESKNNKIENNLELEIIPENNNNKSADDKQIDIKPSETNQMSVEKNNVEEENLKNDLIIEKGEVQKKLRKNENIDEYKIDQAKVFYVQVASLSEEYLVEKEWNRLKKKHSEYIKNLVYISQKAELKGNRTFFRLLVGKFNNKNEANKFCNQLTIRQCIIKRIND